MSMPSPLLEAFSSNPLWPLCAKNFSPCLSEIQGTHFQCCFWIRWTYNAAKHTLGRLGLGHAVKLIFSLTARGRRWRFARTTARFRSHIPWTIWTAQLCPHVATIFIPWSQIQQLSNICVKCLPWIAVWNAQHFIPRAVYAQLVQSYQYRLHSNQTIKSTNVQRKCI